VKAFNWRFFAPLVIVVGMLGFAGCGPDNESEGQKLSTKLGDPGKAAEGSTPKEKGPDVVNQADRAKQGPQGTQSGAYKDTKKK